RSWLSGTGRRDLVGRLLPGLSANASVDRIFVGGGKFSDPPFGTLVDLDARLDRCHYSGQPGRQLQSCSGRVGGIADGCLFGTGVPNSGRHGAATVSRTTRHRHRGPVRSGRGGRVVIDALVECACAASARPAVAAGAHDPGPAPDRAAFGAGTGTL